jgi:hypothetical protein
LPPEWFGADRDILLSVGDAQGAMQLTVNDHLVSEQTSGHGQWLAGTWLNPGVNSVKVRVDTTLLNRMVALRASGMDVTDWTHRAGRLGVRAAWTGHTD